MSSSKQATAQAAPRKRIYRAPKLTVFGPLTKLTQNGVASFNENFGQGRCGANFQASGKASC